MRGLQAPRGDREPPTPSARDPPPNADAEVEVEAFGEQSEE